MRIAIVSDIHGNLEALKEVLADIDRSRIDEVLCLGDCVGYGAEPESVVELIRDRGVPCIMGNHELGVLGRLDLAWFNSDARKSILLTRRLISHQTMEYIGGLPSFIHVHGALCVHGCPPASVTTYILSLGEFRLRSIFNRMEQTICFVGHTHALEIIGYDGTHIRHDSLHAGLTALDDTQKYIINVGSVGQPRDGNNNAKYVIWDISQNSTEVRFVPYNIAATSDKIIELGFPEFFAKRLWQQPMGSSPDPVKGVTKDE